MSCRAHRHSHGPTNDVTMRELFNVRTERLFSYSLYLMNPWLNTDHGRTDSSIEEDDVDNTTPVSVVRGVRPSDLTQRTILESPRRAAARRGYGFHKAIQEHTHKATQQFESALTRLQGVKHSLGDVALGRPMVSSATLVDRAAAFYDEAPVYATFLSSGPCTLLWERQEEGVAFMVSREKDDRIAGGIIANVMRSGKTLMICAHILRDIQLRVRRGESRFGRPTLFIVPPQAVDTIAGQIKEHFGDPTVCPLNVIVLSPNHPHQSKIGLHQELLGACDIIISTYNMVTSAFRHRNPVSITDQEMQDSSLPPVPMGDFIPLSPDFSRIFETDFLRIVADEAHLFCNQHTQLFRAMMTLRARFRWYVTGTPIRNSLEDLLSPLSFIRVPAPLPALDALEFRELLHSIMLRQPLPPVNIIEEKCVFMDFASPIERRLYARLSAQAFSLLKGDTEQTVVENQKLTLILRLRQACVEPRLLADCSRELGLDRHFLFTVNSRSLGAYLLESDAVATLAPQNIDLHSDKRRSLLDKTNPVQVTRLREHLVPIVATKTRHIVQYFETHIEHTGDKLIVFSSWATFLTLLGDVFDHRTRLRGTGEDSPHIIVHGNVDDHDRARLFQQFRADPQKKILLLTFGTGGVSMDLTIANHVILPDPWFNPYAEEQALARLKGVRQKKTIYISRLYINDTIDCGILSLSKSKRRLEDVFLSKTNEEAVEVGTIPLTSSETVAALFDWLREQNATERHGDDDEVNVLKRKRPEDDAG